MSKRVAFLFLWHYELLPPNTDGIIEVSTFHKMPQRPTCYLTRTQTHDRELLLTGYL